MEPAVVRAVAVESAYWLFSHRKTSGSFHTAARFMASWITPWLDAPSPNTETAPRAARRTRGGPRLEQLDRRLVEAADLHHRRVQALERLDLEFHGLPRGGSGRRAGPAALGHGDRAPGRATAAAGAGPGRGVATIPQREVRLRVPVPASPRRDRPGEGKERSR